VSLQGQGDQLGFYSRNLATEYVIKASVQKAKNGGTPGWAPVGYLNYGVSRMSGDRTVEVDPVRGPLVAWAFETYGIGE
jgi:site-specific DNA recombinase